MKCDCSIDREAEWSMMSGQALRVDIFEGFELNAARACVLCELQEELGIAEKEIENLHLRYVTLRRSKGEIRRNYYFFADLKDGVSKEFYSNEGVSRWFSLLEVTSLEMPEF